MVRLWNGPRVWASLPLEVFKERPSAMVKVQGGLHRLGLFSKVFSNFTASVEK